MKEILIHTLKQDDDKFEITVWASEKLEIGECFNHIRFHNKELGSEVVITKILENRNHAGSFPSPEMKINSFYRLVCERPNN
jgi:hypothetical protein